MVEDKGLTPETADIIGDYVWQHAGVLCARILNCFQTSRHSRVWKT